MFVIKINNKTKSGLVCFMALKVMQRIQETQKIFTINWNANLISFPEVRSKQYSNRK